MSSSDNTTPAPASPAAPAGGNGLFNREVTRHRLTARRATVVEVSHPVEHMIRVTVTGPDFGDFVSTGPGDHAKVFFPDAATGLLHAPTALGADVDGVTPPDGPTIARDYTPLNQRVDADGRTLIDLDFLTHPNPGTASAWAEKAAPGDELVIAGPRGSRSVPHAAPRVLLVVDGTALPAASRYLKELPASTPIEVVADIEGDLSWVSEYLRLQGGRKVTVHPGGEELVDAVTGVGVDDQTFVFAAGEASRLVNLRRHLRRELGFPPEQLAFSGYWKRGVADFDHHTPIDPDED
ncbi:MAG: siderophore-interacting protein [Cryobacterium sp.]|nr:siderophore-interacting protein [Cryobacterium sp.]